MNKFKTILISLILIMFVGFIGLSGYMNLFLKYLLLYIIIMAGSVSLSYFSKKRIDRTIPLYFIITFIFLYIFGILRLLLIGLYLYLILNLIIDIYVIYKVIKNREFNDIKNNIITPASIIYTILFFTFMIFTKNAAFYIWDEFSFWSIATKNMFHSNSLYLNSATTLYNVGYPPCPTILEYFFCKIINNYSQGIELFAYQMFGFSLFLPFFKKNVLKDKLFNIAIFISILFIPAIFVEGYFYKTIYADSILGILVGYILYEYFTSDKDKFLTVLLSLSIATLALTKATGIVLAFIVLLIIVFDLLINKSLKKDYKKLIILLVTIVVSYALWKLYVSTSSVNFNNGYINQNNNSPSIIMMLKTIFATLFGGNLEINTTFQTFFSDFFDKPYYSSVPFGMTGSIWLSIFIISYILVYKYIINKKMSKKYKVFALLIGAATILYIAFLQIAYYLKFSQLEAVLHNSMQRYVGTIFIAILMFIVGVIITEHNKKTKIYLLLPVILLPFTPINILSNATIASGINNAQNQASISIIRDFAEYVKNNTEEDARIFAVHQNDQRDSYLLQFRYFMTPRFIPMIDNFDDSEKYSFVKFKNVEEFNKELYDNYDYLVVLNSNQYFVDNYGLLFNDKISNFTIYKIEKNNNVVTLIKI